jgi:dienelactone hydrolase
MPMTMFGRSPTGRRARPALGAAILALILLDGAAPAQAQETRLVPVTLDGQTVRLEIIVHKPPGNRKFPTLVFNHGSTGRGNNPSLFRRPIDVPVLARHFVERGWAVVLPARRGRGNSEGLYDEGFNAMRTNYTCETGVSLAGAERALRDVEAAMGAILAMPFVDTTRVVMGGWSRGGILSVAYAGAHPGQIKGVVNFVGGWMGTGCLTAADINQALFRRGARYAGETLWLYGDGDPFYALAHSRANFAAFTAAGGKGTFLDFPAPAGRNGHMIPLQPDLWATAVDAYFARLRLPARAR